MPPGRGDPGAAGGPEGSQWREAAKEVAEPAVKLLRQLGEMCHSEEKQLEDELQKIQKELAEVYEKHALQEESYQLFAIWVHQGEAGSGHYLAFLKDWSEERWVRFSDSLVSFVTWEEVQAASVGDFSSKSSAYVLVYMDSSFRPEPLKPDETPETPQISALLMEEIKVDNKVLHDERGSWEDQLKSHPGPFKSCLVFFVLSLFGVF